MLLPHPSQWLKTTYKSSELSFLDQYSIALISILIFTCIYFIHRYFFNTRPRLNYEDTHFSQVFVSFLHSCISSSLAILYILHFPFSVESYENLIVTDYDLPIDFFRRFCIQLTLGYMISDIFQYIFNLIGLENRYEQFNSSEVKLSIIHHVLIIFTYCITLHNHVATFPDIVLISAEISTPFLHLRYFMRENERLKNTILYPLTQLTFAILFFIFRILFGSFVLFCSIHGVLTKPSNVSILLKTYLSISLFLFMGLQFVWFWRIIRIVFVKLFPKKSHNE